MLINCKAFNFYKNITNLSASLYNISVLLNKDIINILPFFLILFSLYFN